MEISIPVYVEKFKRAHDNVPVHRVSPLFRLDWLVTQERLQTAMSELGRRLRLQICRVGQGTAA